MKIEIRKDSITLDGYVNVVQRDSRELPSPRGFFIEQIMPKAFDESLRKNSNVDLLFNHQQNRKLGSVQDGNLQLFEDAIGLRAIATIKDDAIIQKAKTSELRGWSFGFIALESRWQEVDGKQRRYVDSLELKEVSILDVTPAYFATTIEARGNESIIIEQRFDMEDTQHDIQIEEEETTEDSDEQRAANEAIQSRLNLFAMEIELLKLRGGI